MQFFERYKPDKNLASMIAQGDSHAWNQFVNQYSDYILSNIISWCRKTCRIISETKDCAAEIIRNKKTLTDSGSTCEEGLDLYVYIFNALKTRIAKYQGKSSLKTYITACLNFIYSDYFITKHGKINIPVALKDTTETDKKVYKVLCRSSDVDNAVEKLERLGIDKDCTLKSFERIETLLKSDGNDKAWQHLYSQFSKNKKTETLDIINENGNETQKEIEIYDSDYTNTEVKQVFESCFNTLESKQKRLLKLKFKNNLSVKDIFTEYATLFKFQTEQEVYPELDKSIKTLVNNIKEHYQDSNVDLKEFKDALYDIFKVTEV